MMSRSIHIGAEDLVQVHHLVLQSSALGVLLFVFLTLQDFGPDCRSDILSSCNDQVTYDARFMGESCGSVFSRCAASLPLLNASFSYCQCVIGAVMNTSNVFEIEQVDVTEYSCSVFDLKGILTGATLAILLLWGSSRTPRFAVLTQLLFLLLLSVNVLFFKTFRCRSSAQRCADFFILNTAVHALYMIWLGYMFWKNRQEYTDYEMDGKNAELMQCDAV